MVRRSQVMMVPMLLGKDGRWGTQDATSWNAYTKWLLDQGVVTDGKNQVVKTPDSKPYFNNDLLGGQ